ncbi:ribosome small subunit-dependent GTPase A [Variovorax sp. PCZ-1]|uniref:ribosome small subunit-dependent GTPase A n=1 Tax=Variovorax sp. PCZ-1 TaxID=2835533 RepID=UPI001BD10F24|nr:ribosome small subunit-dependent GTPase A [Variovorax sp. PCZ-1]MBS7806412.1 ribosome small subunit-dependent GTPase A [Variovorax sp. PCZ-1]
MRHRGGCFDQSTLKAAQDLELGLVIASFGRHCLVESPDGRRTICHPRGKKSQAVVGDKVQWLASEDEGTIERVDERRNLLYRQDEIRSKMFAANLDQALILIAAEPEFSESQLTRALIACEAAKISPIIALNKSDLQESFERAWERLAAYRHMHYGVLPLSLRLSSDADQAALMKRLQGKTTLVLGPSGVGKSTLVNLLAPQAREMQGELVKTQEISQALNSGKHTTTSTTLYWLDEARQTALIDSPGFQEFGLHHIEPTQLASLMPDLAQHLGQCKFYNCTHLHEPGCGVREHVISEDKSASSRQEISARRYQLYSDLFAQLSAPPNY